MIINASGQNFPKKRAAVFMDRDGTLNLSTKPDGSFLPVNKEEDLVVYDFAKKGLKDLTEKTDLLKILVTNQGGVDKGYTTLEDINKIHNKLLDEVRAAGGDIDAVYVCTSMDKNDPLRKPNPGMILKAAEEMNIDLAHSYMIGDRTGDIACGERADQRLTTIALTETGSKCQDGHEKDKPDVEVPDFQAAADFILKDYSNKKE